MIIDCKDISSIKAVLGKKIVNFITFNSKNLSYESKNYFITNLYAFIGYGDAVRLRKIYPIDEQDKISILADDFANTLKELNTEFKVIAFEGSVKEEDAGIKMFKI